MGSKRALGWIAKLPGSHRIFLQARVGAFPQNHRISCLLEVTGFQCCALFIGSRSLELETGASTSWQIAFQILLRFILDRGVWVLV